MMETLVKIVPKFYVYIVDPNYYDGVSLKKSLEKSFEEEVVIKAFSDAESCLRVMEGGEEKPNVVILEYTENRRLNETCGEHMVDCIKKLYPDTAIIILSDKENSDKAIKILAYGAHDFVVKDRFLDEHILSAVKKSLHPAKM